MFRSLCFIVLIAFAVAMPFDDDFNEDQPDELVPMVVYRVRRQLSGSRFNLPGGGYHQSATLRGGPAFGSVSQSFDRRGVGTPQTFSGGLDFTNKDGHGVTFGGSKTPSRQGTLFAQGRAPLINSGNHRLDATASHTNVFGPTGQRLGEVNTGGLDYQNKNGFGANVGIAHTPGRPNDKQIGITYQKEF